MEEKLHVINEDDISHPQHEDDDDENNEKEASEDEVEKAKSWNDVMGSWMENDN